VIPVTFTINPFSSECGKIQQVISVDGVVVNQGFGGSTIVQEYKLSEHLMKVDNNQITSPTIGQCTGGTPTYTDSKGSHPIVYSGSAGANFPIQ
jgi:hypothetical protein